jgi:hypothetical protein
MSTRIGGFGLMAAALRFRFASPRVACMEPMIIWLTQIY